jgi:hypothetical protein
MEYLVEQIKDTLDLLQAKLLEISNNNGQVINVLWRGTDSLYVVVYALEKKKPLENQEAPEDKTTKDD